MKIKLFLLTTALLTLCVVSWSQQLSIGDKVPDIRLKVFNHPNKTVMLSDYRGKLLLLDFWTTTCSSCFLGFPKLDSLKKKFPGKVEVLLVIVGQSADLAALQEFYQRWGKKGRPVPFPTVYDDKQLLYLFPLRSVPHYAWVGPDGTVVSVTGSKEVTVENITAVLNKHPVKLVQKIDKNPEAPLYFNVEKDSIRQYNMFVKGFIENLVTGEKRAQSLTTIRHTIFNQPISKMYSLVSSKLYKEVFFGDKLSVEVSDSSDLLLPCSVEYAVSRSDSAKLLHQLFNYLNEVSGYTATLEERRLPAYLLVRTSNDDKLKTTGGAKQNSLYKKENRVLQNSPFRMLLAWLSSQPSMPHRVYDETGYGDNIDFTIGDGALSFEQIQQSLHQYGLALQLGEKTTKVLVIKNKASR